MSSVQYFRELISERLTAAAEEIFSEFEKTIIQYEDVINRQRRLLDIGWKQKIKFRTVDFSQQHVCNQQKKQSLAQPGSWIREEPEPRHCQKELEPPTIKQEQEELWISQDVEQLVLKQEDETFMKIQYESSCDETFMRSNVVQQEDEAHGHHSPPVIGWKPVVKLHRIDPHQLPVSMEEEEEEEVLTDQQICNQERNFSLDQDEPQPPQIREDQDEPDPPQIRVDQVEVELPQVIKAQGEPDPHIKEDQEKPDPQIREDQDEPDTPQISVNQEEVDPRQIRVDQEEVDPPQIRVDQDEPDSQIRVDQEEVDPPQIRLDQDKPNPPQIKEDQEKPDPQIKVDQEEPESPQIKEDQGEPDPRQVRMDQEEPEPPQSEEQEKVCSSQDEELLEPGVFVETPVYEESFPSEAITDQLFSHHSHVPESPDQDENKQADSESAAAKTNSVNDSSLLEHLFKTHACKTSNKCGVCGRVYKKKSLLSNHLRSHTGEKLFICEICGIKVLGSSALERHHQAIHSEGRKPYTCTTCGKNFLYFSSVQRHEKTHTDAICEKSLHQHHVFVHHTRSHTDEKPHSYNIRQGKRFPVKSNTTD